MVIYWHLDIVKQKILGKFFYGQNKRLVSRANLLIATSPNYVDGSRYLSSVREKCKVVPNCINVERLSLSKNDIKNADEIKEKYRNKIICLAVGRHTAYKGFEYLIEASKYLDSRFEIFIAGKGELTDELKKAAGEDQKIHFMGLVPDNELRAYLAAMDIFCFPSITKNEAFGLALAEGMFFGKPAVTFTIPGSGVNYVNLNQVTGIEVGNRDAKAYAEALKKLADNPELRKQYGESGKKRVEENFLDTTFRENIKKTIVSLEREVCA